MKINFKVEPKAQSKILLMVWFLLVFLGFHLFCEDIFCSIFKWPFLLIVFALALSFFDQGNKAVKYLSFLVSFLLSFFYIGGWLSKVLGTPALIWILVPGTIALFFKFVPEFFGYEVNLVTTIYLFLTTTSIVLTSFSDSLVQGWHKIQSGKNSEEYTRLSLYFFNQNRIKHVIFITYFVGLLAFNIVELNGYSFEFDGKVSVAIIQSFASYIAFDRLLANRQLMFDKKTEKQD